MTEPKFPEGLCEDEETQRHFFDGLACALLKIGVPSTNVEWEMGWSYGDTLRRYWARYIKGDTHTELEDPCADVLKRLHRAQAKAKLFSEGEACMAEGYMVLRTERDAERRRAEKAEAELEIARHALGAYNKQYGEVLAPGCEGCSHEATLWKCTHLVPHPSQNPMTVAQYTDSREARIKELEDKYDKVPHALQGCQGNLTEAYKRIEELERCVAVQDKQLAEFEKMCGTLELELNQATAEAAALQEELRGTPG